MSGLFPMLAYSLFFSTGLWGMGFGQVWLALSVFTLWKHTCHYHHRVSLASIVYLQGMTRHGAMTKCCISRAWKSS
jgi:hypothetical protein